MLPKFRRPIDGALYMARLGLKVFPLRTNSKLPAHEGWQIWADQATMRKIEDYGTANPTQNWGVMCRGITVLDIDNKNNKQGLKAYSALIAEQHAEHIRSLTVTTPTGGYHVYLIGETVGNTAGTIGEGLDTRSTDGGYVVAPGSRIDENVYEFSPNSLENIQPIPTWFERLVNSRKKEPLMLTENEPVVEGTRTTTLLSIAGTLRNKGLGYDALLPMLLELNKSICQPVMEDREVESIARSIAQYEPKNALVAAAFLETPEFQAELASDIIFEKTPKRDWIMQGRYIGGFISLMIAPGGVGKSTVTMLDAISVATGRNLNGYDVIKKGGVWLYNTEDPRDEMHRRIEAVSTHYGITNEELENVHITSGRDKPLVLAKSGYDGVVINKEAINAMCKYITDNGIVLLFADPFVRTHQCNENDNMEIDTVAWCFQQIAERTGCAVGLVHHTNKAGSSGLEASQGDMNIARGASALIYACRVAHTLVTMSKEEAAVFGIAEDKRGWYLRMDNAKSNLQPPAEKADWYERRNVNIYNGDAVGVLERVELKNKKAEKLKEEMDMDAKDLAEFLNNTMQQHDKIPVREIVMLICADPMYSHLFSDIRSTDVKVSRIIAVFRNGVTRNTGKVNKIFTYLKTPNEKCKHWITCDYEEIPEFLQ